jgi:hypothetical protein
MNVRKKQPLAVESDTRAVFDRYNITSTDDVKDAIKTVTRYNKRKAGK